MAFYKKINDTDISKANYVVNKNWELNQSSDGIVSRQFFSGSTDSSGSNSYSSGSLWDSLRFTFYASSSESDQNNHKFPEKIQGKSGGATRIHEGASKEVFMGSARLLCKNKEDGFSLGYPRQGHHYQYLNKFGKDWISGSAISISQRLYGDRIKPGTFELIDNSTDTTIKLKDDKYGNIYAVNPPLSQSNNSPSSSTNHIGNIFYENGLIVLKETSSFDSGRVSPYSRIATNDWTVKFQSSISTTSTEYILTINPNEFNGSSNPTIFDSQATGSGNPGKLLDGLVNSNFSPYITTVGLYDRHKKLVMVGRLSQPVKKSKKLPLIINMIYDY